MSYCYNYHKAGSQKNKKKRKRKKKNKRKDGKKGRHQTKGTPRSVKVREYQEKCYRQGQERKYDTLEFCEASRTVSQNQTVQLNSSFFGWEHCYLDQILVTQQWMQANNSKLQYRAKLWSVWSDSAWIWGFRSLDTVSRYQRSLEACLQLDSNYWCRRKGQKV